MVVVQPVMKTTRHSHHFLHGDTSVIVEVQEGFAEGAGYAQTPDVEFLPDLIRAETLVQQLDVIAVDQDAFWQAISVYQRLDAVAGIQLLESRFVHSLFLSSR